MSEVTECDSASEVKGIHNQNQFHNDPYPHSLANTYLLSIYYVPGLMLQPQLYLRNKWMQIASTYTIQRLKGGKLNFKMPSALSHLLVQHPHILQFHFQMQIPSRCRFFPSTFPPSLVMKGREEEKPRQTEAEPFPAGQRQRRAACVPSFQTLILLFSYVQYLEMLLLPRSQTQIIAFQALSHLILTRSCKVHIICIIVIA